MTWVLLFIAIGLVLVFFEVLVPGGVLGVLAFASFVTAAILVGSETGNVFYGILTMLGIAVVVVILVILQLKLMGRGPWRKKFYLEAASAGKSQEPVAGEEVIGKQGITVTRLTPSGVIEIEGKRIDAFSQSGFLEKGVAVMVEKIESFHVVVRKVEKA